MDVPGPERRLAAVLAADMVGFSRLMEADEAGTLARLKTHRIELIDPAIAKKSRPHHQDDGRRHARRIPQRRRRGAVRCRNSAPDGAAQCRRPPPRWIQFRIGINLGDVIVDQNDIFGDGVNVAARLEALAEPGGICISGAVRDQLGAAPRWRCIRGYRRAERQEHRPSNPRLPDSAGGGPASPPDGAKGTLQRRRASRRSRPSPCCPSPT